MEKIARNFAWVRTAPTSAPMPPRSVCQRLPTSVGNSIPAIATSAGKIDPSPETMSIGNANPTVPLTRPANSATAKTKPHANRDNSGISMLLPTVYTGGKDAASEIGCDISVLLGIVSRNLIARRENLT